MDKIKSPATGGTERNPDVHIITQNLSNLPHDLLQEPRFFALGKGKDSDTIKKSTPKGWNQRKNQALYNAPQHKGRILGFDITARHAGESRFVVFDFDHVLTDAGEFVFTEAEDFYNALVLELGETYVEKSISGHGLHMVAQLNTVNTEFPRFNPFKTWFRPEDEGNKIAPHLETFSQSGGRYLLFTGDNGEWSAAGQGLAVVADDNCDAVLDLIGYERPTQEKEQEHKPHREPTTKELAKIDAMLAVIPAQINYDEWFSVGIALRGVGANFEIWDAWSASSPEGYPGTKALETKWKSFQDSRSGWPTLLKIAKAHGFDNTSFEAEWKNQHTGTDGLLAYALNDAGNAQRLKAVYGDVLRYVENAGWISWTGKNWTPPMAGIAPAKIRQMALDVISRAKLEAGQVGDESKTKFFHQSENAGKIRGMLDLAQGMLLAEFAELDADIWQLNTQSGILDLRTGNLKPHDKDALCTRITGAAYTGNSAGSLWEQTLCELLPDEATRDYFQRWAGYCLTGSTQEEKILFMFGRGGCGKGTLSETIQKALGTYADTFDTEIFLQSRNDGRNGGQSPTPELAKLQGVRFALGAETEHSRKLSAARLKNLTGGDSVTARLLHQNPISFKPQCKFVLQSNYMPQLRDATDDGLRRRIVVIKFDAQITPDRTRKASLQTDEELAACLSWCVEGCRKWQARGLDEVPEAVLSETRQYFEKNDQIKDFLDSCCVHTESGGESVAVLLHAYNAFAGKRTAALSRADFVELMERHGYVKQKIWALNGKYGFAHLKLQLEIEMLAEN